MRSYVVGLAVVATLTGISGCKSRGGAEGLDSAVSESQRDACKPTPWFARNLGRLCGAPEGDAPSIRETDKMNRKCQEYANQTFERWKEFKANGQGRGCSEANIAFEGKVARDPLNKPSPDKVPYSWYRSLENQNCFSCSIIPYIKMAPGTRGTVRDSGGGPG